MSALRYAGGMLYLLGPLILDGRIGEVFVRAQHVVAREVERPGRFGSCFRSIARRWQDLSKFLRHCCVLSDPTVLS